MCGRSGGERTGCSISSLRHVAAATAREELSGSLFGGQRTLVCGGEVETHRRAFRWAAGAVGVTRAARGVCAIEVPSP
jgi:hypothetical protein